MTRSDTLHETLYIECKYGKSVAPWTLFMDTVTKADKEYKVPVVILKKVGGKGFLVVCRNEDLEYVGHQARYAREASETAESKAKVEKEDLRQRKFTYSA